MLRAPFLIAINKKSLDIRGLVTSHNKLEFYQLNSDQIVDNTMIHNNDSQQWSDSGQQWSGSEQWSDSGQQWSDSGSTQWFTPQEMFDKNIHQIRQRMINDKIVIRPDSWQDGRYGAHRWTILASHRDGPPVCWGNTHIHHVAAVCNVLPACEKAGRREGLYFLMYVYCSVQCISSLFAAGRRDFWCVSVLGPCARVWVLCMQFWWKQKGLMLQSTLGPNTPAVCVLALGYMQQTVFLIFCSVLSTTQG